jgi:small subunit ribosomal protein S16
MLKIRLQRTGRKHEPSFRLVLTNSKNSTKSGRFNEVLGSYDPRKSSESFNADRIKHWLSQGAGLTGSVSNLFIKKGLIRGQKIHVGMDNVAKVASAPSAEEASIETPAEVPMAETSAETPVEPAVEMVAEATPAPEAPQA